MFVNVEFFDNLLIKSPNLERYFLSKIRSISDALQTSFYRGSATFSNMNENYFFELNINVIYLHQKS